MYKYIEIIEDETSEVVSRMDVTTQSERNLEKILGGINRNLNHNAKYLRKQGLFEAEIIHRKKTILK